MNELNTVGGGERYVGFSSVASSIVPFNSMQVNLLREYDFRTRQTSQIGANEKAEQR